MKHKRLISIIISVILSIGLLSASQYVFANDKSNITISISDCKDNNIKNALEKYYTQKYLILSNLNSDDSIKNYTEDQCNETEILSIMVAHCRYQIADLRFNDNPINLKLRINGIQSKGDDIIVDLTEHVSYTYNCEKNGIKTEEIIEHKTMFDKNYKIKKDTYDYDFKNEYEEIIKEGYSSKEAKSKILSISKESADKTKKEQLLERFNSAYSIDNTHDNNIVFEDPLPLLVTSASFTKHTYNRLAATNYALTYALSPNTHYMNIESNGGNCTNFTSQCLRAGGIKDDRTGNYKWYYASSNDRAPAWSSANEFRKYYKNNVGSTSIKGLNAKKCTFKASRKSDLVQWVTNNKAKHTMFIDDYACDNWGLSDPWNNKWDVYICQNSTSASSRQKHKLLSSKPIPSNELEYIHINSCYY